MSSSQRLSNNAINALTINDLVFNSKGEPVTLSLRRYTAVEEDGEILLHHLIPGPGAKRYELSVSVKDEIGYGRTGTVYEMEPEYLWENTASDSEEIDNPGLEYIPPLVLKVSNFTEEDTYTSLARECINYKNLDSIQGIAIPRCYGWFNVTLASHLTVKGQPAVETDRILSILLLERVGECITLQESEDDREDMEDLYGDLASHRTLHGDIRRRNICLASSSRPGYSGEHCNRHRRVHKYRIIDLEHMYRIEDSAMSNGSIFATQAITVQSLYRYGE